MKVYTVESQVLGLPGCFDLVSVCSVESDACDIAHGHSRLLAPRGKRLIRVREVNVDARPGEGMRVLHVYGLGLG